MFSFQINFSFSLEKKKNSKRNSYSNKTVYQFSLKKKSRPFRREIYFWQDFFLSSGKSRKRGWEENKTFTLSIFFAAAAAKAQHLTRCAKFVHCTFDLPMCEPGNLLCLLRCWLCGKIYFRNQLKKNNEKMKNKTLINLQIP